MCGFSYALFEFWSIPIALSLLFFFYFLRSLMLLGDYFNSNPFFEKRRHKHSYQFSNYSNRITPLLAIFYSTAVFRNFTAYSVNTGLEIQQYAPLFFLAVYVFLRIGEKAFYTVLGDSMSQSVNSSGLFLVTFIPVASAMLLADNLINMLLPLELLGVLFYFVFLEFSYSTDKNPTSTKNRINRVMKGLLYYFWLSFVGSAVLITAIALASTQYFTVQLYTISLLGMLSESLTATHAVINVLVFLGLSFKMGGFFFFFFKSELYKLLPMYGVILFSIYSAVFYLLLIISLSSKLPFFLYCCKYSICLVSILITAVLFSFTGFSVKNIYTFAGLSSVLTICFCLVVLV